MASWFQDHGSGVSALKTLEIFFEETRHTDHQQKSSEIKVGDVDDCRKAVNENCRGRNLNRTRFWNSRGWEGFLQASKPRLVELWRKSIVSYYFPEFKMKNIKRNEVGTRRSPFPPCPSSPIPGLTHHCSSGLPVPIDPHVSWK